jgi:hypothetical protein
MEATAGSSKRVVMISQTTHGITSHKINLCGQYSENLGSVIIMTLNLNMYAETANMGAIKCKKCFLLHTVFS